MLQNLFRNMQPVVKNLLIINLLFFLATVVFEQQGIMLNDHLALYYFDSPHFQPYQLVTHFFMHGDFMHLLFNMIGLIFLGTMLERHWGGKRFLIFFFATALGGVFFHQLIQMFQSIHYMDTAFPYSDGLIDARNGFVYDLSREGLLNFKQIVAAVGANERGASGAIYGIIAAVGLLFPNTTVYLYMAIPVKMKWLAIGLAVLALYQGLQSSPVDGEPSVGHLAHLTGMLMGLIIVKIWQKDRNNFY